MDLYNLPFVHGFVFTIEVVSFLVLGFAHHHVDVICRWLVWLSIDQQVGVTCSAPKDLLALGHVTSVAWQIVFIILDEGFRRHF